MAPSPPVLHGACPSVFRAGRLGGRLCRCPRHPAVSAARWTARWRRRRRAPPPPMAPPGGGGRRRRRARVGRGVGAPAGSGSAFHGNGAAVAAVIVAAAAAAVTHSTTAATSRHGGARYPGAPQPPGWRRCFRWRGSTPSGRRRGGRGGFGFGGGFCGSVACGGIPDARRFLLSHTCPYRRGVPSSAWSGAAARGPDAPCVGRPWRLAWPFPLAPF